MRKAQSDYSGCAISLVRVALSPEICLSDFTILELEGADMDARVVNRGKTRKTRKTGDDVILSPTRLAHAECRRKIDRQTSTGVPGTQPR
jgi:hypothetical protein